MPKMIISESSWVTTGCVHNRDNRDSGVDGTKHTVDYIPDHGWFLRFVLIIHVKKPVTCSRELKNFTT